MGKTEGPGRIHLNCKVAPDIKKKVIDAVSRDEAASNSDYVSRCILYYHDTRPLMEIAFEQMQKDMSVWMTTIMQELTSIKNEMAEFKKEKTIEGKSS